MLSENHPSEPKPRRLTGSLDVILTAGQVTIEPFDLGKSSAALSADCTKPLERSVLLARRYSARTSLKFGTHVDIADDSPVNTGTVPN